MKVYYNEKCSVCRLEIEHYKKQNNKEIKWVDIHESSSVNSLNTHKRELVRRLHVQDNETVYIGVDAFKVLWSKMENYKFLARLLDIKIIYKAAYYLYELVSYFLYIKNHRHIND